MLSGFKQFIFRGNVVDLAVAVVMGAAFGTVVTAAVKDMLTPLIAAIAGKPRFSGLKFTLHHSVFLYGSFLNAVVSFVLIAAGVYFMVVLPMNRLMAMSRRNQPAPAATTKPCPECLSEVPIAAKRCAHCTVAFQFNASDMTENKN